MTSPRPVLTEAEREHFLQYGYLHLRQCFTRDQASEVTKDVWTRLGMSADDRSTWTTARTHMPWHKTFDASVFAPRAWSAICELCGGEDRISPSSRDWHDSFIVNLGSPEGEGHPVPPKQLDNWHVDGDFFVHYLDSPEQGLLVIPLFTDIQPNGGGTMICPDAIPKVAQWLYQHPDGVSPRMVPRDHADFARERNLQWYGDVIQSCGQFVEAAGQVGDVYLLHPLMMHSATNNALRRPRIITNPPVSLEEPFCFSRERGDYSLVEQKTIQSLGGEEKLKSWQITKPREAIVPERVRNQEAMKRDEARRLQTAREIAVEV
ncbi:hypothetical protein PFICI_08139 [Pestalotiopsis fici W106-1]|uniref:Uncharacterized protein n=1 Tax=Pestalotiopsis fici (strain W106-1 / CGMCC3.15140) TaxID=1229662 RepID=W3X3F4_PESFW|nr:uncharacterized protein PFICI_08139 [Pestalotiopsis fici W106-1]ETS80610.1 hypothetical protein PFICI_08139 [Pestalotiopsis fici W106-1]